ncbi:Hypothetical Protein FCC1311_039432 [Hondaea fermentalgiana]|uniref:Uncharacterized protein n=1 Tax=Hondaea fermentalgiana TaxID=2315210 RepID=A0A2R5G9K6_9STRA|nr:Hypothetical Protein FCC1311_039432 [Hondaea fermentalgiana]|eukprot:GBG27720.1 Hypothetical Protein FCC1311_039432 [Hondaea fermentalgiana]
MTYLRFEVDGGELEARELSNIIAEGLSDYPAWLLLVVYASIGVGAFLLLLLGCYLCRCIGARETGDPALAHNPYPREYATDNPYRAGGGRVVSSAPALADFMRANPVHTDDSKSGTGSHGSRGSQEDSDEFEVRRSQAIASYNKRVSTNHSGEDYGRLDADAKERIRSIRVEGNLQPFGVAKPSAKALRMLGVEETAIQRPFDEDIQTRMERVATRAGGGLYAPGLATAKLGGQIAQGFKERRAKQLEKAEARKAREEEQRRLREAKMAAQGNKPAPPPKPTTPKPEAEMKPGPNKLAAFLATTSDQGQFANDDDDDDEEEDDDSDSDDSLDSVV